MTAFCIAYDMKTGRIVSVHHGPAHAEHVWTPDIGQATNISLIRGPFPRWESGKRYKVDVASKDLAETSDEDGVGFGAGKIG
jgi:hypothetical protein